MRAVKDSKSKTKRRKVEPPPSRGKNNSKVKNTSRVKTSKPVRSKKGSKPELSRGREGQRTVADKTVADKKEGFFSEPPRTEEMVYGRNPVLEALRKGGGINKIIFARGASGSLTQIKALAREKGIPFQEKDPSFINNAASGVNHQGVIAYVAPVTYMEFEEIVEKALERFKNSGKVVDEPLLVLLDGLEDPHNLGAILRSVDGAGGSGVVIPKRRAVPLTATVAKTSAGAVEYVPVSRVTNLVRAVEELQDRGFLVVGTDADASGDIWSGNYRKPLALVIGGEGKGISRLLKEKCDLLVRIPMAGQVSSLNASVSAALLLYEIVRQRSGAGEKGK